VFSEWGNMTAYAGAGFYGYYWTSEANGSGNHYLASLFNGYVGSNRDSLDGFGACRQGL